MGTTIVTDALIYPGRLNALNGEPAGGKTWVALHTCAEAIQNGYHALYIDLEDHPGSIVGRLKALGCSGDEILERFHYIQPGKAMSIKAMAYVEHKIRTLDVALVVIDSIGELASLQGTKDNDDEMARLYRLIPRALAKLGPAVLLLDHVPKNKDTAAPLFGIGSQRKKAAIDGAAYMVETVKAFAADTPGKIVLRTAKDRNGNFVVGHVAAEIDLTPQSGGDRLILDVHAPELDGSGMVRQTTNMGIVSRFLEGAPGRSANRQQIIDGGLHQRHFPAVMRQMESEGWVTLRKGGPGKADTYTLVRPFDALMPSANATQEDEF